MQVAINILVASSTMLLLGVGFALIYRTTHFFHFAHAVVYTCGAYLTLWASTLLGLPIVLAVLFGATGGGFLGVLMEFGLYRPMRRRSASPLTLLIASLGLYIILQNAISLAWGDDVRMLQSAAMRESWEVLGARITTTSVIAVVTSSVLLTGIAVLLRFSGLGRAMRAVADDPTLARIRGIRTDRVILGAFALGSALAAVAGILVALDVSMRPTMGLNALMLAIVAVIIGGVGSIGGVVLGSLLLALVQQLAIWQLGAEWQEAVAFAILLAFLLARPQGMLGWGHSAV